MTDLERAAVFGAQAWDKAGKGKELTVAESRVVLRTLGSQMFRKQAERPQLATRELVAA